MKNRYYRLCIVVLLLGACDRISDGPLMLVQRVTTTGTGSAAAIDAMVPVVPFGDFHADEPMLGQPDGDSRPGIPDDWYNNATADIAASEYHINYQAGVGAFQSPNRKQNLRITYHGDGFDLEPRTDSAGWKMSLTLDRIGRPGDWSFPTDSATITTEDATLTADHGDFAMDYRNTTEGMRQNFTVRQRPAGEGPLQVRLNCTGDLHAADMGGNAIAFCASTADGTGRTPTVWYKDLHVWDAIGDTLQATATLDGGEVVLSVLDAMAQYPITVDPMSTTAGWTGESDQVTAHFGQSVCSAGDVNGDGYSDIIIGADDLDNGQTNEGRAYVFHGSANGVLAVAAWTAESNSANALFGSSVSTAGDVNGDGFSDVIVGAPELTNGQNLEGRVYVFFGSAAGLAATAAWIYESNTTLTNLGAAVALAGDINAMGTASRMRAWCWSSTARPPGCPPRPTGPTRATSHRRAKATAWPVRVM